MKLNKEAQKIFFGGLHRIPRSGWKISLLDINYYDVNMDKIHPNNIIATGNFNVKIDVENLKITAKDIKLKIAVKRIAYVRSAVIELKKGAIFLLTADSYASELNLGTCKININNNTGVIINIMCIKYPME
jgi:hypothetical protein